MNEKPENAKPGNGDQNQEMSVGGKYRSGNGGPK